MNDLASLADILLAAAAVVTAGAAAWTSWRAGRRLEREAPRLERIEREVTTMNAQTLAQLADAGETQRIEAKRGRGDELTPQEQEHIDMVDEAGRRRNGGL